MSEAHLPETGSIEVVGRREAAELVEEIAEDTENPRVVTERLLIALDIDGTVVLEDQTLSPGIIEAVAEKASHSAPFEMGPDGIARILS